MKPLLFCLACASLLSLRASASLLRQNATATDTVNINADSLNLVRAGDTIPSGPKQIKFSNGRVSAEGTLRNWTREGWWSIYREDGTKASEVDFVHGKDSLLKAYDEHGNYVGDFTPVDKEATFPGGDSAWTVYVRTALLAKIDYLSRKKAWGHAEVEFIVEKDGSLSEIAFRQRTGTKLDDVILDLLKKSPRWNPAIQYNRPIRAYRREKFTLQAPD